MDLSMFLARNLQWAWLLIVNFLIQPQWIFCRITSLAMLQMRLVVCIQLYKMFDNNIAHDLVVHNLEMAYFARPRSPY